MAPPDELAPSPESGPTEPSAPEPARSRKGRKKAGRTTAPDPVAAGDAEPSASEFSAEPTIAEAESDVSPSEISDVPSAEDENPGNASEDADPELPAEASATEDEEAGEGGEPAPFAERPEESHYALPLVVESILFASQKPMSAKELLSVLKGAAEAAKERPESPAHAYAKIKEPHLREAIESLEIACASPDRAYEVRESAAGWQLVTKPHYSPWLRQLFPEHRSARLSGPALETLAIIAYRQPITRADIEAVRGVAVDGVMQTLLDRGLVKIAGRADVPGRPLLYDTTQNFMEHFGLKNLDDLPNASELRKISLPTAEPPAETPARAAAETASAAEIPPPTETPAPEPPPAESEESTPPPATADGASGPDSSSDSLPGEEPSPAFDPPVSDPAETPAEESGDGEPRPDHSEN